MSRTSAAGPISSNRCTSERSGRPSSLPTRREYPEPFLQSRTPKGFRRTAVRLVKGRFENERDAEVRGDLFEPCRGLEGRALRFDHTRSRDQHERILPADPDVLYRYFACHGFFPCSRCFKAAAMKDVKSGCGLRGVDLNSGWNWQPRNQGWSLSSTISTSSPSGDIPLITSPAAFNTSRYLLLNS